MSASESITRRSLQEHHPPFTLLQTYATTLTTVRPTTGPGHLQEHYPNFLQSVAAQDGLRYYRHDLLCPDRADCVSFSQTNVNVYNLIKPRRNNS